jgi:hypothetical protein
LIIGNGPALAAALRSSAERVGGFVDDVDLWIILVLSDRNGVANAVAGAELLPRLQLGHDLIAFGTADNNRVYRYNFAAWLQFHGQPAPRRPSPIRRL